MSQTYFIGLATRKDVMEAAFNEGYFYDKWLVHDTREYDQYYKHTMNYQGVDKGSIGFLYYPSHPQRILFGVFEALGAPENITTHPKLFGNKFKATLRIPVKLKEPLMEIHQGMDFLQGIGFSYGVTTVGGGRRIRWPSPRVFGEDKGRLILAKFKQFGTQSPAGSQRGALNPGKIQKN